MKKILIVDDMESWRDFNTNAVLSVLGKEVDIEEADCAAQAYNKLLEHSIRPYDIIITDLQMESDYTPKHAGEWLVEQVRSLPKYYKTKIIMVSASSGVKQIADSLGIDYIRKADAIKDLSIYEELLMY